MFAARMIILFYLFGGSREEIELPLGPPNLQALGLGRAGLSPWHCHSSSQQLSRAHPQLQLKTCTFRSLPPGVKKRKKNPRTISF